MTSKHGAYSIARLTGRNPKPTADAAVPQVIGFGRGFRSFIETPTDEQRFRFMGKPLDSDDTTEADLRQALRRLSFALEHDGTRNGPSLPPHAPSEHAGVEPRDNPNIPSGYTYLLQLMAHDLVQSATSLSRMRDEQSALVNNRTVALCLESIYGGGPENSPLAYSAAVAPAAELVGQSKAYLRLGPFNTNQNYSSCPFRELGRASLSRTVGDIHRAVGMPPPEDLDGPDAVDPTRQPPPFPLPDALISDPRNDDNPILAQLTALFHLLHNGLVDLAKQVPEQLYAENEGEAAFDRYLFGRMATALIYRRIIREDLMRRLLHGDIYRIYASRPVHWLDAGFGGGVPRELTHGALRVLHAMPRARYEFNGRDGFLLNEVLEENSQARPERMPLRVSWATDWSYFFDLGGAGKVNLSGRLCPRYDGMTGAKTVFPPIDSICKPGLAYRDMMSASLAKLWSVSDLFNRLRPSQNVSEAAKRVVESPLANDADRRDGLRKWLDAWCLPDERLNDGELDTLSKDPPLPLFLMYEALIDPGADGRRLGPLGSLIVAEFVFHTLDAGQLVVGEFEKPLEQILREVGRELLKTNAPPGIPPIASMAELVRYVASLHGLENAKPKFM